MADLSSLLQLSQQMQGRLTEIQTQLAQQTLTVSAGGGMVQATVDGRGHIRAIKIDPSDASAHAQIGNGLIDESPQSRIDLW